MSEHLDVTSVRFRRNRLAWQTFATIHDVDPNDVRAVTIDDDRLTFHCYAKNADGKRYQQNGELAMVDVERRLIGPVPS